MVKGGGGGNYGNFNNQNSASGSEFREGVNNAETWINSNWELFLGIVIGSVLCILIINLLVLWISSRGKFMLLDGIVKNRAAVVEPWNEFKTQANSLCIFRFMLSIIGMLCVALTIGLPAYLAYPDFQADTWGAGATNALVALVCLGIPFAIAGTAIAFFLSGFVVPTMYLRRVSVMEGWRLAWGHLCKGHLGSAFLLFLLPRSPWNRGWDYRYCGDLCNVLSCRTSLHQLGRVLASHCLFHLCLLGLH